MVKEITIAGLIGVGILGLMAISFMGAPAAGDPRAIAQINQMLADVWCEEENGTKVDTHDMGRVFVITGKYEVTYTIRRKSSPDFAEKSVWRRVTQKLDLSGLDIDDVEYREFGSCRTASIFCDSLENQAADGRDYCVTLGRHTLGWENTGYDHYIDFYLPKDVTIETFRTILKQAIHKNK